MALILRNYTYGNFKTGLIITVTAGCLILAFQYISLSFFPLVSAEVASGLPLRIIIPRIHINAVVEEVSQNRDGSIKPPKYALNTGWDRSSSRPGENGTAIIDGYVNWKYGSTAVFADLHSLKPGDIINVENDKGETNSFVVRESVTYDLHTDIKEMFRSSDGKSHLNLITYDGIYNEPEEFWNKYSKNYFSRLVVFTDEVVVAVVPPQ